jgi:hypothetical protein
MFDAFEERQTFVLQPPLQTNPALAHLAGTHRRVLPTQLLRTKYCSRPKMTHVYVGYRKTFSARELAEKRCTTM